MSMAWGRPLAFILTKGNRHDLPPAAGLIEPLPKAGSLLADAAYDSDAFRAFLAGRGTKPAIKQNPTRKKRHPFDKDAYRGRNVIERAFCRLKELAADRHTLRQAGQELRRPCRPGGDLPVVDLIESGA